MATVLNERQKTLNVTSPRISVTGVTLSGTTGTFIKPKNLVTITPASVTITATTTGYTTAVYSWSYAVNTSPNTWVGLPSTSANVVISNSSFVTAVSAASGITYRCIVTQNYFATSVGTYSISYVQEGDNGTSGLNGTRTAILDLYQWASNAPSTFPSGTSVYTWSTAQFTAPPTLNSWTTVPSTPSANQRLYIARQLYSDTSTSATSVVTWNTTTSLILSSAGSNGSNGQRVGALEVYRWSASAPTTYPTGTSVYTWSDGTFTLPTTPNGWSLTPGAAVQGQTLWGISVTVSNNDTTPTNTVTWNSNSVYAVGYAGNDGGNAITINLSNESHVFPATSAGVVSSYANSGTLIRVYEGSTELDYDSAGTANGTWTIASTTTSNITVGAIGTTSLIYAEVNDHSNVAPGVDSSSIVYTVTGKSILGSSFTLTKTQTFSKSKSGINGTAAVIYSISSTSPVIVKDAVDVTTSGVHSSVTLQGRQRLGTTTTNYGWLTITGNGDTENATATDTSSASISLNPANSAARSSYTVRMYNGAATATSTLLDVQTINVIFKGPKGEQGTPGLSGSTAVFGYRIATGTTLPTSPTIDVNHTLTAGSAATTGWYVSPKLSLNANEWMFQVSGTRAPSGVYTWETTTSYLSTFKVGTLSALGVNTGSLNVDNVLRIGSSGKIQTTNNSGFSTVGIFLGEDNSAYKFSVGTPGSMLSWDGSQLSVPAGNLTGTIPGSVTSPSAWNNTNIIIDAVSGVLSGIGTPNVAVDNSKSTSTNMLWGTQNGPVTAGPGSYGVAVAILKNGTDNVFGIQPGETLTLSADLWQDSISAAANQASYLYLYSYSASGTWISAVSIGSTSLTPERKSGSVTLSTTADNIYGVAVGLYHQQGTDNTSGSVFANRIQLQRGGVATPYAPGHQPGANQTFVDNSGLIQGVSQNSGTAVRNSNITIDVNGILQGIGTTNTSVANSAISINNNGVIQGIGTSNVQVDNKQAIFTPVLTWNFTTDSQSWTALQQINLTYSGTGMTTTATGADPIIFTFGLSFNGAQNTKVRVRCRRLGGTGTDALIYYTPNGSASPTQFSGSYYKSTTLPPSSYTDWTILEFDMANLTAGGTDWTTRTITSLRLDLPQNGVTANSDRWEIDWISVGDYVPVVSTNRYFNSEITISETNGVISLGNAGGGSVTTVTANNKISTTNISTFLSPTAITGNYIAANTIDTGKLTTGIAAQLNYLNTQTPPGIPTAKGNAATFNLTINTWISGGVITANTGEISISGGDKIWHPNGNLYSLSGGTGSASTYLSSIFTPFESVGAVTTDTYLYLIWTEVPVTTRFPGTTSGTDWGNENNIFPATYNTSTAVWSARTNTGSSIAFTPTSNSDLILAVCLIKPTVAGIDSIWEFYENSDIAARVNAGSTTISGGRITTGSIDSLQIAAGAIKTDKLFVTGRGSALNDDPFTSDAAAWPSQGLWSANWTIANINDGPSGSTAIRSNPGASQVYAGSRQLAFNPRKAYRVRCKARSVGATGSFYLVVDLRTTSGSVISGDGTAWYYPVSGQVVPSTWQDYEGVFGFETGRPFPTNAATMSVGTLMNFASTAVSGYHEVQDLRIEERVDSSLIVDGGIIAGKLAANSVTAGNIAANAVFAANIQSGAITTDKLLVTGRGQAINDDPGCQDLSAWQYGGHGSTATRVAITDSVFGSFAFRSTGTTASSIDTIKYFPVSYNKKYRLTAWARGNNSNGLFYLRLVSGVSFVQISFSGLNGVTLSNSWSKFSTEYSPATTDTSVSIRAILNWAGSAGYQEVTDIRLEEKTEGDLIVDGTIVAGKLAANAVEAANIAAGAISATKLVLSNFTNLVENPTFANNKRGWVSSNTTIADTTYGSALSVVANSLVNDTVTELMSEVVPGERYYLEGLVRTAPGTNGTVYPCGFFIYRQDKTAISTYATVTGVPASSIAGNTWVKFGGTVLIPSDGRWVKPWVSLRNDSTTGTAYYTNIQVRRMNEGQLIVDGAITAQKISVNDLNAIVATTGSLLVNSTLSLDSNGVIKTTGINYNGNGIFLGRESGTNKFSIGSGSNNLSFDGTTLTIPAARIVGVIPATVTPPSTWENSNITSGRNLVRNFSTWTFNSPNTLGTAEVRSADGKVAVLGANTSASIDIYSRYLNLPFNNDTYTISFMAFVNTGTRNLWTDLFPDTLPQSSFLVNTTPTLYKAQWLLTTSMSDASNCRLRFFADTGTSVVYIYNVQLEYGNSNTPWKPNEADIQNEAASQVSFTTTGEVEVSGGSLRKAGGINQWDVDSAYSKESYSGGAYLSFIPNQNNKAYFIGLNGSADLTTPSYSTIDYAYYVRSDGTLEIRQSNTVITNIGSYQPGDVLAITYDGVTVRYSKNGVVGYATAVGAISGALYFDSDFYSTGASCSNINFGPLSSLSTITISNTGSLQGAGGGQITTLTAPDVRWTNEAPNWSGYPVGITMEFKRRDAISAPGAETYGILRTEKPWSDSSGGYVTQTFKSGDGEWKRLSTLDRTGWQAWTPKLDRQINAANISTYITAAAIGDAYIGNLDAVKITAGTLDAARIAANSITASKLVLTGAGAAINDDPMFEDAARSIMWPDYDVQGTGTITRVTLTANTDANAGSYALRLTTTTSTNAGNQIAAIRSRIFPISPGKTYRVSLWARKLSGATSTRTHVRLHAVNASGSDAGEFALTRTSVQPSALTFLEDFDIATTWTRYTGRITFTNSASKYAYLELYGVYQSWASIEIQDFRWEEMVDSTLVVDGAVTAQKINITGGSTQGRIVINTNQLLIYDDSNAVRVKIGLL